MSAFLKRHRVAIVIWAVVIVLLVVMVRVVQQRARSDAASNRAARGSRERPVAVTVATATVGNIDVRIPALGTVTTLANVTVRTQVSGILQRLGFIEGQLVRQGDFLAQIDPRPYEAALQQARGTLRHDEAALADAKLNLTRYEGLVKEDSIAQQTLDTQRALVDQYQGTLETDRGQVATAQVNLGFTRIVAPVTGRVGLRQVDPGNYVTAGDTNGIVVVNQVQPISIIFSIPEDNVPGVTQRLHAGTPMKVEAFDRANAQRLADGKVLTVDNEIDTTTGTVKVRAQFDNADGSLYPNQFVNVQLLQESLPDQLVIPNSAVRRGAPNGVVTTYVYLVNPDRTVAVRPVTLGTIDGERVAVTAGLQAGDRVVTEGGDRLRDGAQVTLPNAAAPGAAHAQKPLRP